ncbi:MAG: DUF3046 domain-containing protein [Actinobacteria bacterium]|nr:DUF3046 domain-containing protein [Actinomycetota bacterium]
MRFSTFWELLTAQLGEVYAKSFAEDQVISEIGVTINQAFALGIPAIEVWRAVCTQQGWPD